MQRVLFVLGLLAAVLVAAVLLLSRAAALHWNVLLVLAMIALPIRLLGLSLDIRSKRIRWPKSWPPDERVSHLVHALIQNAAALIGALAISMAVIPAQLGEDLMSVYVVVVGLMLGWSAMAWLPRDTPRWGLTAVMVLIAAVFSHDLAQSFRTPTPVISGMVSPLGADSEVMHGGSSPLINHHALLQQQLHALDLFVLRNGSFTDGPADALDSYGCWGAPVRAPADGVVVRSVGELPDNEIGETDFENLAGNHLVIEIGEAQFVLLAHLQSDSLGVQVGDQVTAGQAVARCGNSGNTSSPHLHFQVMNKPDFSNSDSELETVPVSFVAVSRGDMVEERVPRRNDRLLVRP